MTNAFFSALKTAFVDPFKKLNSQTPTLPTLKTSTNNLMSMAPKPTTPIYPTPSGKPITPAPNMSTVNGPVYGGAPQTYNSQTIPLLSANVGPSTFANVKSTAPVVKPTVPTITAPKTAAGGTINPSTGGIVPSPTTPTDGAPMTTPTPRS